MKLGRVERNEEKHGVEIYFNVKPNKETRQVMKDNGFRFNPKKLCWYTKETPIAVDVAEALCSLDAEDDAEVITAQVPAKEEKPAVNKFGVKVGTLFSASWGYDQTNVNYFQVIELVGKQSVRVREVKPIVIKTEAISGMSEDIVVQTNVDRLLEPTSFSVFIKDQEKGDLKRLKSYAADGVSNCQFYLDSFADAHICTGETQKDYVSWYA